MTIRPGVAWGTVGPTPDDLVVVDGDAALGALVGSCRTAGTDIPPVALRAGDLLRSLGDAQAPVHPGQPGSQLPVDVVRATLDGRTSWFVAHLVARTGGAMSWWRGEVVAAMNAEHLGRYDVAPRSHPNDGRVDVLRVASGMALRQRWRARTRAVTGVHLPHPDLTLRHAASIEVTFARELEVFLDGTRWGRGRQLELHVEPDALLVCI